VFEKETKIDNCVRCTKEKTERHRLSIGERRKEKFIFYNCNSCILIRKGYGWGKRDREA
jgi:hypothetical protein